MGKRAPLAGRLSMDMLSADITDAAGSHALDTLDEWAQVIGDDATPDMHAAWSGTIGYEVLTSLALRSARFATSDSDAPSPELRRLEALNRG